MIFLMDMRDGHKDVLQILVWRYVQNLVGVPKKAEIQLLKIYTITVVHDFLRTCLKFIGVVLMTRFGFGHHLHLVGLMTRKRILLKIQLLEACSVQDIMV